MKNRKKIPTNGHEILNGFDKNKTQRIFCLLSDYTLFVWFGFVLFRKSKFQTLNKMNRNHVSSTYTHTHTHMLSLWFLIKFFFFTFSEQLYITLHPTHNNMCVLKTRISDKPFVTGSGIIFYFFFALDDTNDDDDDEQFFFFCSTFDVFSIQPFFCFIFSNRLLADFVICFRSIRFVLLFAFQLY